MCESIGLIKRHYINSLVDWEEVIREVSHAVQYSTIFAILANSCSDLLLYSCRNAVYLAFDNKLLFLYAMESILCCIAFF